MKRVIEVHAGSLEEGLKGILDQIAQDIVDTVEGGDHLLKETVVALKSVTRKVTNQLEHISQCENCGKHTERTAALEVFKVKMEEAIPALQAVIDAEKVVQQETKKAKGVK